MGSNVWIGVIGFKGSVVSSSERGNGHLERNYHGTYTSFFNVI
jgi:hypothetical protein